LGVVDAGGGVRFTERADVISAVVGDFDDFEGAALAIRQFGDAVQGGVTVNSNPNHDDIAECEEFLVAVGVDAGGMVFAAVLSENLEDFGRESGL